ncbi:MAG TPA: Fic family protein [Gammaproteobacteria bacterium]
MLESIVSALIVPVWFHHRLTRIHPFRNGNGRHARLMTNQPLISCGQKPFTWGRGDLVHSGEARKRYIAALREADRGNLSRLAGFVRSAG